MELIAYMELRSTCNNFLGGYTRKVHKIEGMGSRSVFSKRAKNVIPIVEISEKWEQVQNGEIFCENCENFELRKF